MNSFKKSVFAVSLLFAQGTSLVCYGEMSLKERQDQQKRIEAKFIELDKALMQVEIRAGRTGHKAVAQLRKDARDRLFTVDLKDSVDPKYGKMECNTDLSSRKPCRIRIQSGLSRDLLGQSVLYFGSLARTRQELKDYLSSHEDAKSDHTQGTLLLRGDAKVTDTLDDYNSLLQVIGSVYYQERKALNLGRKLKLSGVDHFLGSVVSSDENIRKYINDEIIGKKMGETWKLSDEMLSVIDEATQSSQSIEEFFARLEGSPALKQSMLTLYRSQVKEKQPKPAETPAIVPAEPTNPPATAADVAH